MARTRVCPVVARANGGGGIAVAINKARLEAQLVLLLVEHAGVVSPVPRKSRLVRNDFMVVVVVIIISTILFFFYLCFLHGCVTASPFLHHILARIRRPCSLHGH